MAKPFALVVSRQIRTSRGKADSRAGLIGAAHAAAKRIGLAEDDRRALQLEVTGKASMADMTLAELGRLLDRLNKDRPAPSTDRPHVGKVRALWWTLYWLGAVDEPNDAAIDAFVARQTGISALRFLDHGHAPPVIEALKAMAAREGVRWPALAKPDPLADRAAVLDAIWAKVAPIAGFLRSGAPAYLAKALELDPDCSRWSARNWDDAIRLVGKRLRRELEKAKDVAS